MDELLATLSEVKNVKPTSNDGKHILAPFLALFESFLSTIEIKFEEFKNEMLTVTQAKDDVINRLQTENYSQKKAIALLESRLDDQDQYTRRESLVFSGESVPVWKQNEDCRAEICQLVNRKLGLAENKVISPADISVAHRLGPKPSTLPDRRNIIARFCRRTTKYDLLDASRTKKPAALYMNESLTPTRQTICAAIRKAKKNFPDIISGYRTEDGSIYVWVKPPNPTASGARNSRVLINTLDKLDEFCRKNFDRPAIDFINPKESRSGSGRTS